MAHGSRMAPTLSNDKARSVVTARRDGRAAKLLDRDCGTVGALSTWDPALLDKGCVQVLGLLARLRNVGAKVDAFNFDRRACSVIHQEMQLPPTVAASKGFWRWMAVERLAEVIEARHGNPGKGSWAHLANYGIDTGSIRSRLTILWLRANMLYDAEASNPYHLAERFLHSDFIESGIIRHRYGWCSNLARAMVKFQYRRPDSKDVYLHSTDPNGIRKLYKRLRHLHSVYAFEFMSEEELWSVLEKHSRELKRVR